MAVAAANEPRVEGLLTINPYRFGNRWCARMQPGRTPIAVSHFISKLGTVTVRRLLAIAACWITAAGCSTTPASLAIIDPAGAEGGAQSVLVVTSREPVEDLELRYEAGRADTLSYNDIKVWVPSSRSIGSVIYPSTNPNADKEFGITEIFDISSEVFSELLNERLTSLTGEKTVFVFVHGYNVPYSNGVYRVGQMIADFEIDAVPVHYSWPSQGRTLGYLYDRDSVQFARDGFVDLLERISMSEAASVFVMGHSMGTLLVMEGLRTLAALGNEDVLKKISPLVLASPDIDVDVFRGQLEYLRPRPDPFIVFVASDDGALGLSERLRGGHARVGEGRYISALQEQGIAVIDLSNVELGDGTQHSAFASSPTLIQIIQQANTAQETLTDADGTERRSPLEALSEFTNGLLYLPKRVIEPGS